MAVTIKDVAALAGVSPSTVSRVCNNNPAISRETQERVRRAMAQLGYAVSAPTEPAEAQAIKMIGIVLPPSDWDVYENPFYLKAIRGISQVCNQRKVGSTVITGRDSGEILDALQTLRRGGRVDGFVLLYARRNDPVTDYLCEQGLLYVVVGKPGQLREQTICIDNDNLLAGREAADYLYRLGHRRIGYLGSRGDFVYAADRQAGYQLSMLLHNLPIRQEDTLELDSEGGGAELEALLAREDRPTAFVVSDDVLGLVLERVCARRKLSIPEDVSIIAFNNSLYARLASPQLTAVDINSYQLGQEAANQLLSHLENPDQLAAKIVVPHRIVERDSCKRIQEED